MKAAKEFKLPATCRQLEAAGYRFVYARRCKRCDVSLEFWQTPAKKWAPLEPMKDDPQRRRASHFATCPFAKEFRAEEKQGKLF